MLAWGVGCEKNEDNIWKGYVCQLMPLCGEAYGGISQNQFKSPFPVAKLPLPVGSEVNCGFRWGSNISDPPLRPSWISLHAGTYEQGHNKVQGKRAEVLATCQGLIIGSLRQTSLPTEDQRWQWYLRESLWWRSVSGPLVWERRVINRTNMKGAHSAPQGDKVVTECCSGVRGGRRGGSLVLRGLLVHSAALLFRFSSQCQGPEIEV